MARRQCTVCGQWGRDRCRCTGSTQKKVQTQLKVKLEGVKPTKSTTSKKRDDAKITKSTTSKAAKDVKIAKCNTPKESVGRKDSKCFVSKQVAVRDAQKLSLQVELEQLKIPRLRLEETREAKGGRKSMTVGAKTLLGIVGGTKGGSNPEVGIKGTGIRIPVVPGHAMKRLRLVLTTGPTEDKDCALLRAP